MADISFLDLMLADALASGLAREARRADKPPPENFFSLPRDPIAWRKIQEASRKENMVVCIEITDNSNENCRRVQGIFMDMAREYEGIPFVRVAIGLGATYDELRRDVGGVQYTPTFLVIFYNADGVSRAKFEGEGEIRKGMATGQINGVIRELINRRVKLRMAEKVVGGIAEQLLKGHISEQERKIREEYETKLKRQMSEREEEIKKTEEEKQRQEEEKEEKKDKERCEAEKILRMERPKNLEELLKMDLDTAKIRDIRNIMGKMGVSTHGCVERADLKKKLMDNVPELRIRSIRDEPKPAREKGYHTQSDDMNQNIDTNQVKILKMELDEKEKKLVQSRHELARMDVKVKNYQSQVSSLDGQVSHLQNEIKIMKNNPKEVTKSIGSGDSKVRELEISLLETRMLYTTSIEDYEIISCIHEAGTEEGCESLVLSVKCNKPGIPSKEREYAMKVLTNYFKTQTQTQVRQDYQNEYEVLCMLPPHPNIIHMWAFFYDRVDPAVSKFFKKVGKSNIRTMSLFILMDQHPSSMADLMGTLVENRGPASSKVISWLKDLLNGLLFLWQHHVVHRDLKLDNLLMSSSGEIIISDFGKAMLMEDELLKTKHMNGLDIGGNRAHLSPEILNSKPGPRSYLNYSMQSVWAAGVIAYELAGHPIPFQSGTIDQRGYSEDDLPPLKYTYCKNSVHCQRLPQELTKLVKAMLSPDPDERPSLQRCLDTITKL